MTSNLTGQDREDALMAMKNDGDFDRWMKEFEIRRKKELAQLEAQSGNKRKGGKVPSNLSKEEFLDKHGRVHGGK